MDHLAPGLISTFVTLLVTIGPVEGGVVFSSLTSGVHRPSRRTLALRSVIIAGVMLTLFAMGGGAVFKLLQISPAAFRVAGGLLLFLQALTLTFSSPGLSTINKAELEEAEQPRDIAVLPLAFPMIAGPASISAVILLMEQSESVAQSATVLALLVLCLALTYLCMRASDYLFQLLGRTGSDVVGRISGILLAALAVQFVFDGLRQAGVVPALPGSQAPANSPSARAGPEAGPARTS